MARGFTTLYRLLGLICLPRNLRNVTNVTHGMKVKTGRSRTKHYPNLNETLDRAINVQWMPRYRIAQAADMSVPRLNDIVCGIASPAVMEKAAIAKALGV